jgi:hypothetical protein
VVDGEVGDKVVIRWEREEPELWSGAKVYHGDDEVPQRCTFMYVRMHCEHRCEFYRKLIGCEGVQK